MIITLGDFFRRFSGTQSSAAITNQRKPDDRAKIPGGCVRRCQRAALLAMRTLTPLTLRALIKRAPTMVMLRAARTFGQSVRSGAHGFRSQRPRSLFHGAQGLSD